MYEENAFNYLNSSSECDYGCARTCFEDYKNATVINTFVSCLYPKCKCMNSFALKKVPQPYFNMTHYETRRNESVKTASERVTDGWPAVIRNTLNDIEGYDLIRDCNEVCNRECFEVKKYVPFDALLQCPRYRCNCWYALDQPIQNQIPQGYFQT